MSIAPPLTGPDHRSIRRRAANLNRRIFASFPWGFRVAELLVHLAGDSIDAFGRVVTAEMILAVVRGLPNIGGKPASDWIHDVYREGANVLPPETGRRFAERTYKILLTKYGSPDIAEEAMSKVMLAAARGKIHISNGSSVHDAESYIITMALNAARDVLRAQGRRREVPLGRDRDDDDRTVDVEDPDSFARLDDALGPSELKELLDELGRVHPRAPEWLRAKLQGDSGAEIAEDWQTSASYVSKWVRTYLPRIKQLVEHHLRTARIGLAPKFDHAAWQAGWSLG